MPKLDVSQDVCGAMRGFKVEHQPDDSFDGSVSLLDNVIEILD
jgi:hypothetical protein